MEDSREKQISDAFFVLGAQYYAVATYAAPEFLMPICGSLFHHAIEMLLKGYLANTHDTARLKVLGHNLVKLWESFKAAGDDSDLNSLDPVIAKLDRFENIRYPDNIINDGMKMGISFNIIGPRLIDQFPSEAPKYDIEVQKLDKLVATIFHRACVPPGTYFGNLPDVFKNSIPPELRGNH
jgi:hypothetical protein